MDSLTKTQHETAVDRALATLETEAGSHRVMCHLSNAVGAPASGIALENLIEALRTFRERAPT